MINSYKKIFKGNSDVTPDEAIKVLEMIGFQAVSTGGSHLTFRKQNCPSITVVITQTPLKAYMLAKLQEALKDEGYKND